MKDNKNIIKIIRRVIESILVLGCIILALYNPLDFLLDPPTSEIPEDSSILLKIDINSNIPKTWFHFGNGKDIVKIKALFDSGSAISTISEDAYNIIKDCGFVAKEYFCPLILTDANGRTKIYTKCAHINIPVRLQQKSSFKQGAMGVRFFIVERDHIPISIGTEFLKEFIIHSEYDGGQWRLNKEQPGKFVQAFRLKRFNWHKNDLGARYYWPLTVGDIEENFFIDTGYGISSLQLPLKHYKGNKAVQTDSVVASHSSIILQSIDDSLTVKAGDLTFDTGAYFFEGKRNTKYVVNPHWLRGDFNISYDFGNKMIYLVKPLK